MIGDWMISHSKDDNFSQVDIQVKYNSYQNHRGFFVYIDNIILKFMCKGKETRILTKTVLKKTPVGGISLTDSQIYYIAMIFKTM